MPLFGNKAKAAALFVAVLVALYGTTEASPPKRKTVVRFGKSGGKFVKPQPGRSSYATVGQYAYRTHDPEYESTDSS